MNWANIVLASDTVVALVVGGLLLASFRRPARSVAERALRAIFIAQLAWILSDGSAVVLAVHYGFISAVHGGITGLAIVALISLAYVFCESYPDPMTAPRGRTVRAAILLSPAPVFAVLAFTPLWVANRRVENGVKLGDPGPAFVWLGLWAILVVSVGVFLLIHRYRRVRDGRTRANLRILAGALVANLALSLLASFLLPLLGVPEYDFIGPIASLVLVSLVLYAINYHSLFDIETAAQSLLVHLVSALLVSGMGVAALRGPLQQGLSPTGAGALFAALFLVGLGYALYLRPRLQTLFRRRQPRPESLLMRLVSGRAADLRELGFQQLLSEILEAACSGLEAPSGSLFAVDRGGTAVIAKTGKGGPQLSLDAQRALVLLHRVRLGDGILGILDRTFLLENQSPEMQRTYATMTIRHPRLGRALLDTLGHCRRANVRLVAPLILNRQVVGFLFLGAPHGGRPYFSNDLELIDIVRLSAAPVIRNFLSFKELNDLRRRAEAEAERLTEFIVTHDPVLTTIQGRPMLYRSSRMEKAVAEARAATAGDRPVLILGETGTGKELIARMTHEERGADRPFVAINCAAVPAALWESEVFGHARGAFTDARADRQGRVEEAGNGTLFFDEIGEMPLEMQAKLLRLLQERTYTPLGTTKQRSARCRFVFATNRDLEERVQSGEFRNDLYYRINVFRVHLPPLRDRPEDIVLLAAHFAERFGEELGSPARMLSPAARDALSAHPWPGNIRELENVMIRAVAGASGQSIQPSDLPGFVDGAVPPWSARKARTLRDELNGNYRELVDDYRRRLIQSALRRSRGNKTRAAEYLGVKRTTLNSQMAELGIVID